MNTDTECENKISVRSLFISDCHLGNDYCSHDKLLSLLKNVDCEYLFLVGDFIDGWALKRSFNWNSQYNTILQKILRLSRKGTTVYYVWGNHDDFLEKYDNITLGDNIHIVRECHHLTLKKEKLLIIHGDQFDGFITKNKWLQKIGSILYDYSLFINKFFRIFKFSFSKFLKNKTKEAVKYISNYENTVALYCEKNNYNSVVCGHIHKPEIKKINNITYYNCGDWIEHNTFIVEDLNGDIQLKVIDNLF